MSIYDSNSAGKQSKGSSLLDRRLRIKKNIIIFFIVVLIVVVMKYIAI